MAVSSKSTVQYVALLGAAFVAAVAGSWFFGAEIDQWAYDFLFRLHQPAPWQTQAVVLAIDEPTLRAAPGGIRGIRGSLAQALPLIAAARPSVVAIDLILADRGADPAVDAALAEAFRITPNLVLATDLTSSGWDLPRAEFRQYAAALGHVHAQPDADGVTRGIPLEKRLGRDRYWALSFEAYRLSRRAQAVETSGGGLEVGGRAIPIAAGPDGRYMRVRFTPPGTEIPQVSLEGLLRNPALAAQFTGKVVFVGVTAVTEVSDRLLTPYSMGRQTTGIEINANAFETLSQGLFLTDVGPIWGVLFSLGLAAAIGLAFRYLPGWQAYAAGGAALALSSLATSYFFVHHRIFPFVTPFSAAWLSFVSAAAFYHLVVRKDWQKEQAARARYQQAMHFVTHEMRTPLSAIQGSSELISKYALNEEKLKQIATLINSESKRLARMVEIFLNVERLSAGQMELKHESIAVGELLALCVERAQPLAERKRITVTLRPFRELWVTGDRELLEYACYNLLTNAIKYSPQQTEVTISARWKGEEARIAVQDQGIGMDQKELKQIFRKFYRTKKAEESGEAGTGIGLSIVQQIVEQHNGRIEVTSAPGEGSCFTLALPMAQPAERAGAEQG